MQLRAPGISTRRLQTVCLLQDVEAKQSAIGCFPVPGPNGAHAILRHAPATAELRTPADTSGLMRGSARVRGPPFQSTILARITLI
jgi:hypothetical protein